MATLEERKAEYQAHEAAGRDYYNGFRSQLTLDVEAGLITLENAIERHKHLKEVGDYLRSGDWKSAYRELELLLPNVHCPKAVIDALKSDIINYIQTNYTW